MRSLTMMGALLTLPLLASLPARAADLSPAAPGLRDSGLRDDDAALVVADDDSDSSDDSSNSGDDNSGEDNSGEDNSGEDNSNLDAILSGEKHEQSAGDEKRDLERGEIGDNVGARQEEAIVLDEEQRRKTVIKTLQRKDFVKLGRWEVSPHLAFVANDPFLNRYILGAGVNYNLTEILAIELTADYSPDFGRADWKPLTKQLVDKNSVSPDISKMTFATNAGFLFSPIYGKVAVGRKIIHFDIFGTFGAGATVTNDDLEALQTDSTDQRAVATATQTHATTNIGGGARISFTPNIAARIEGRSLVYIETINSTTLEMKNMLILQGAFSIFFPSMRN